jgi:hypothetical protein
MIGISSTFDFKAKDPSKSPVTLCLATLRMRFGAARLRSARQPHVHHFGRKLAPCAALTKAKDAHCRGRSATLAFA